MTLDGHVPSGPSEAKWEHPKGPLGLVNPAYRRTCDILVVGTGVAGASAEAPLGVLG